MNETVLNDARNLQKKIKEVLMNEWDPIGVKLFPEAHDEYDAYVATVYQMIRQQKAKTDIYDYLIYIEKDYLELCVNRQRTQAVVDHIFKILDDS